MLLDATQNMLPEQAPVLQAIQILDRAQAKIALVVDAQGRLTGSVVDGDVRRGLLRGHGLQTPVREIMHRQPYVLPVGATRQKILQAMQVLGIKQVPLVTAEGLVTRIAVHDLLLGLQHGERPNQVVVMAGGKGKRLLPITQNLPKPLVQVGGKPIIEWILLRLRHYGFRDFSFAVNYLGHMIEDYFGDGSSFGCRIRYVREKEFLGTAGALSLLPPGDAHPLLVVNGDILSGVDFGHLVDFHAAGGRSATVCARAHRIEVPYGVIEMRDGCLRGIIEKPVHDNLISAGIYVLSPQALRHIPQGQALDMPELLLSLLDGHHDIGVFVLEDEWVDVGRHDDLERVRHSFTDG